MTKYRERLPQLEGRVFLTDGGIDTTLIFGEGIDLPFFSAFHLLRDRPVSRSSAVTLSHAELDEAATLDSGDPASRASTASCAHGFRRSRSSVAAAARTSAISSRSAGGAR